MKIHLTLTLLLLALTTPIFAQEPTDPQKTIKETEKKETKQITPTLKKITQEFSNLPKETREDFSAKLLKIQNLFNQKRIFDAFEKLNEIDKIFPNHPAALNIKGACYVEIRAFDKANKVFKEILAMAPDNVNVLFNLAEVDFVTKNWKSAEKRFQDLIPRLPVQNKAMVRLCEFKLLLCKLKLNKKDEALALKNKYDEWDDSPFFYYASAAIAYDKDEKLEAEKQLRNVQFVWRNNAALSAWQDTLIEFGYLRSFYGGE